MVLQANMKNDNKICAFCKYWYDPTNSAISPRDPRVGLWQYDGDVRKMCTKKGTERRGASGCPDFECKIPK